MNAFVFMMSLLCFVLCPIAFKELGGAYGSAFGIGGFGFLWYFMLRHLAQSDDSRY